MFLQYLQRFWARLVGHIDGPLLSIVLVLMGFGLATVYSATYDTSSRALGQLLKMCIRDSHCIHRIVSLTASASALPLQRVPWCWPLPS